jgi:hypothetical protein
MSGYVLMYGFEQKNEYAVPAESPLVVPLNVFPTASKLNTKNKLFETDPIDGMGFLAKTRYRYYVFTVGLITKMVRTHTATPNRGGWHGRQGRILSRFWNDIEEYG